MFGLVLWGVAIIVAAYVVMIALTFRNRWAHGKRDGVWHAPRKAPVVSPEQALAMSRPRRIRAHPVKRTEELLVTRDETVHTDTVVAPGGEYRRDEVIIRPDEPVARE